MVFSFIHIVSNYNFLTYWLIFSWNCPTKDMMYNAAHVFGPLVLSATSPYATKYMIKPFGGCPLPKNLAHSSCLITWPFRPWTSALITRPFGPLFTPLQVEILDPRLACSGAFFIQTDTDNWLCVCSIVQLNLIQYYQTKMTHISSRGCGLGIEMYQCLVSVSSRQKLSMSRSRLRLGYLRLMPKTNFWPNCAGHIKVSATLEIACIGS